MIWMSDWLMFELIATEDLLGAAGLPRIRASTMSTWLAYFSRMPLAWKFLSPLLFQAVRPTISLRAAGLTGTRRELHHSTPSAEAKVVLSEKARIGTELTLTNGLPLAQDGSGRLAAGNCVTPSGPWSSPWPQTRNPARAWPTAISLVTLTPGPWIQKPKPWWPRSFWARAPKSTPEPTERMARSWLKVPISSPASATNPAPTTL